MADLATLQIKVDSRDIDRAKKALGEFGSSAKIASEQAVEGARRVSSAFSNMSNTLKAAAAALAVFQAAAVFRFSDEATKFTAQLKLATRSTEEFARAQADVQRIARIAQQDISTTGVLYARLANSLRDLGANQTQIANVTESVALALKVSGASAQEASSAMLQLSQAFASGVLRGEEFNSVSEAAPRLMRLLADSLGVPIGKLREMAQNGELTADKVANALIPAVEQLRKEAQQTSTISGAFTVLRNEVVSFVAELNKITAVGENLQRSVPLWTGALQVGLKGIAIAGLAVKAVFEALGTAIGSIAAAVMFLVNGEFANAANVMKNFAGDVMNMGKGFIDATKAVLDYEPATGAAATTTELLANTTGKADKAAEKAAKAYAKLRETFAAQVQDLMRYIALVQQGVSVEEANLRVQLERQGALQGEIQTIVDLTAERDALTQSIENEAKARQDLADNIEAQRKAALRDAESIEQQAKAQVIANEAYGQTGVALAILTESRNLDRAAELERFAAIVQGTDPQLADAYMRQAAAIRELADARIEAAGKVEDAERAKKQLEDQTKEARKLEDVFRDVGRSLTDSLFRSFESGKGFLQSFVDSVKNTFKSLVIRFAVQPVLSSVVGSIAGAFGFSGAANASGAAGGAANNLQNLTGLTGIAQSITGGVVGTLGSISTAFGNIGFQSGQSFLAGVSNSLQGGVGTFASAGAGSTAFQIGQFAGKALPFLPGVFSLLEGNFVKAATQTAGTAIGLAIGGPIGGAIGSFIGGLFGGSGPKAISTQAVTTLAGGTAVGRPGKAGAIDGTLEGLGTINQQFLQQLDGLLRAAKVGNVGDVQVASELSLFDKRRRGGFNFQVSRNGQDLVTGANDTFGNDVEEIATALAEELLGPALRDAFIAIAGEFLTPAIRDFLSAVETPQEISQRIALVNQLTESQDLLNEKFGFTVEQILELANAGANVDGVLGGLSGLLTVQEAFDQQVKVLEQAFERLNVAVPESSKALRDLILNTDKSTAEGRELAASLAALAPAFQQIEVGRQQIEVERLQRELEKLNSTIDGLARRLATLEQGLGEAFGELLQRRNEAREVVLGLYDNQLQAVEDAQSVIDALGDEFRDTAAEFDNVIRLMRDFRGELDSIAASSGPAALAIARAQFESVARNARLGNLDAANQLPGIGRDFLNVSAERSVSREDFLRDLASVRRATEDVEGVALRQKSIAEQQLDRLGVVAEKVVDVETALQNLETAQAAADATRATLERLGVLGEQQVTIEDAIRNLETAEQAVATAQAQLEQSGLLVSNQQTTNELLATIAAGLQERASLQQSLSTAQNQRAEILFPGVNQLAQGQVESAQMSGMVANASAAAAANQFERDIQGLYQSLLGRAADVGGFQSFVSSNQSLAQIEQVIRQSQEFSAREQFGAAGQNEFNRIVNDALGVQLGVEAFANGGMFGGGVRLVGERGPELEFTGPSRIYSNSQSADMLRPDMSGLESRMEGLERAIFQVAKNTGKTSDLLRDWDDGGRMNVRVEATAA